MINVFNVKNLVKRRKILCQEKERIFINAEIIGGRDGISMATTPQGGRSISLYTANPIPRSS